MEKRRVKSFLDKFKLSKSIKTRLALSYILIIFFTIAITDYFMIGILRTYFYNNIEETLESQLNTSVDYYKRYFADDTLENNVLNDVDFFWSQTNARVQIIDTKGKLLMDSYGYAIDISSNNKDIKKALKGESTNAVFSDPSTKEKLMAVSMPIVVQGNITGALRFITSLEGAEASLRIIFYNFGIFGFILLILSTIVSNLFGRSITRPIEDLTKTAEIMASGNLDVVSEKKYDDEIGKLSDTLNYMASEIKKKEELKNDFISSISHELRTPLTSIKGWAITLNDDETDKELLDMGLDIISNESDRLKDMVDELLDFSKFVSGNITLKKEEVSLYDLFLFLDTNMTPRANREGKKLITIMPDKDKTLFIDFNRMKQLFINLLDNAFKFTEKGGRIVIKVEPFRDYIDFSVEDDGHGISKEDLGRVKEKFFKGKSSSSTNGIGLSICDEIAKLHGGELLIKSELDKGTKVTLRMPKEKKNDEKK